MRQEENGICLAVELPLALAARLGAEGCAALKDDYRSGMGQFLTPPGVASLLAAMFESATGEVRLLDAGAGVGTLTAAFVENVLEREQKPRSLHLTAWEAENEFVGRLNQVMEDCVEAGRVAGVPTSYELNHGDMLHASWN
jgi:adenine-specific DNA-methyltransferase